MFGPQEHYLSLSLAVYLAASIIVATVRWGHRCRPYARHMDYYHPAWRAEVAVFLSNLITLSPHRMMEVEQLENGGEVEDVAVASEAAQEAPALSPERQAEIEKAIRRYMEDGQAYTDSHLTLADLARGIGINRTYVSTVINDRMGGFFTYVNRCRYDHLTRLRAERPDALIGELIDLSGFSSRNTYYKIKKHLDEIALNEKRVGD